MLQRFVRLEKSRSAPGSGLGLSLVSAVVHLIGGRLELADNVPFNGPGVSLAFAAQPGQNGYANRFSWGYRLIAIIKYESVLPGISVQPFVLFGHDVNGTAPGPAENFIEDRKQLQTLVETRYRDSLSFTLGYAWFWGAGAANLYRDRDYAQAFVRYQF